ncbi:MAG: tetratricopeptide repeat protein [Oceanidesulfovibrio sp.]
MAKIVLNQVACTGLFAEDLGESGTYPPGSLNGCRDFVIVHWSIASDQDFSYLRQLENANPAIPYIVMFRDKDGPRGQLRKLLEQRGSRFSLLQPFSTDSLEEQIRHAVDALPESLREAYRHHMGNGNVCFPFDLGGQNTASDPLNSGVENSDPTANGVGADDLGDQLRSALLGPDAKSSAENGSGADATMSAEECAVVNWFDDPEFLGSTQRLRDSIRYRVSFNESGNSVSVESAQEPPGRYGVPHEDVDMNIPEDPAPESRPPAAIETGRESTAVTARRHFSRGKAALANKNYTQAIRNFTSVLQLKPGSPQAYKGLAVAFRGKGDLNRSSYFLGRACQSYIWCGRFQEGLAMHAEMKKRGITTVHPFGAVAQTLVKRGRLDKALRLLEQGRKIDPKDADMLWAYALLLSFKGDTDSAIHALDDLLASAAKRKDAKDLRARLLSKPPRPDTNGEEGDSGPTHDLDSLGDEEN